jgi:hypothetical protein
VPGALSTKTFNPPVAHQPVDPGPTRRPAQLSAESTSAGPTRLPGIISRLGNRPGSSGGDAGGRHPRRFGRRRFAEPVGQLRAPRRRVGIYQNPL